MAEYIDRNKIYEAYEKTQQKGGPWNFEGLIGSIPAADVAPVRHGQWIMMGGKRFCSECKERACVTRDMEDFWYTKDTAYCPNCGAKMDGEAQ